VRHATCYAVAAALPLLAPFSQKAWFVTKRYAFEGVMRPSLASL
jgi:hypothetical protein